MNLYPSLETYLEDIRNSLSDISEERKQLLEEVASYVREQEQAQLNFICTHNSRRSHLGQVWAQVAADYYGVKMTSYSGGTEATAFNPNAIAAIRKAGFDISVTVGDLENPRYEVRYAEDADPMICFSKTYDDETNPSGDFAAIMTCAEADAECPFVPGASLRIKLLYEDPKVADGTPEQEKKYDERCKQIATEMMYIFSRLKS